MDLDGARRDMVERLADEGIITDQRVREAMLKVPRHLFVPPEIRSQAYDDRPLGIGHGQTISAPHMVAIMVQRMALRPGMKVLEIGAGSGYHAAVMAELVRPGGSIFSLEIVPKLVEQARENLRLAHCDDIVEVILSDGTLGHPSKAPFDRISVAAAGPDVPKPLMDQLADGGMLLIPIGSFYGQELVMMERTGNRFRRTDLGPVMFVPLVGKHGF